MTAPSTDEASLFITALLVTLEDTLYVGPWCICLTIMGFSEDSRRRIWIRGNFSKKHPCLNDYYVPLGAVSPSTVGMLAPAGCPR